MIKRGADEAHKAGKEKGKTTAREKAYIAAVVSFYSNSKKRDHDARAQ